MTAAPGRQLPAPLRRNLGSNRSAPSHHRNRIASLRSRCREPGRVQNPAWIFQLQPALAPVALCTARWHAGNPTRAHGSAILAGSLDLQLENRVRRGSKLVDQRRVNGGERNLGASIPKRVRLSRASPRIHVNESLLWRPLREFTKEPRARTLLLLDAHREIERKRIEIAPRRLNELHIAVHARLSPLQRERDTGWHSTQRDAQRKLRHRRRGSHIATPIRESAMP